MEKITLAASPNWYLSQVFDCSTDNRVAYGALASLVILDPLNSMFPETIHQAHTGRILSVSFPPQGYGNKLLSTSDAGEAFVWNLDTRKAALAYKNPQKCAVYGNWSPVNGNLIVCADENGHLLQWRLDSNSTSIKFLKEAFVVIACCPHNPDLVATGTRQGLVCVINIKVPGKEFILHKLRGHDSEVVSLSWCPVRENVINPKSKDDCLLLASGAKEKKIFFWRAGQDGLYEAFVETALVPRTQAGMKLWNCVCWNEPHQLLVSTVGGEVLSMNVSQLKAKKGSEKKHNWIPFSGNHNRCHVVVKSTPWRTRAESNNGDWRHKDNVSNWVWTFGTDRVVAGICSDKGIPPVKLNTFGGPIYAMTISPIDGTSLAIGVGDKSIRVVNLSEPELKTMQTFNQKVSGKVMSLSWHPSKDGWLAYGTSDGRIGIQFTCTVKPPIVFRPFTTDSIYALEWGPSLACIKSSYNTSESSEENAPVIKPSNYVLYAVGGGRVVAMDFQKPDQYFEAPFKTALKAIRRPESLKAKNKTAGLTDLAWKPDFTILAVGDELGSIHLLKWTSSEDLHLVASFKAHSSLIQDLAWHPQCCASDVNNVSPQANWLACGSNDVNICIFDTTNVADALHGPCDENSPPISNIPCIATLKGHKLRVSKLAWSPHEGGRLLSVSYDQCAQVWDVINRKPIVCYVNHHAPLFACEWSPFNPSLALTAGQEGVMCVWDVEEQETKLPISKSKDAVHLFNEVKEISVKTHDSQNGECSAPKKSSKKREKALLPLSGPNIQNDSYNFTILEAILHPTENEDIKLNVDEKEGDSKALPLHYAFFANQPVVEQYLMMESKSGIAKENSFTLNVWRGSMKDAITEAIQTKSLSSYIVSLAPMVSHKMWVDACTAYAEQLKEESEHSRASAYLLAIHRVEDAINVLAENGKYRHAVAVARCRLPAESSIIKGLLLDWGQDCVIQGQPCLGAVCFASAGEWTKSANCLSRKKTPDWLLMAARIMREKCPEDKVGLFYARECFEAALSSRDWITAQAVLNLCPNLNHLALRLFVHELIYGFKDSISPGGWLRLCNESKPNQEKNQDKGVTICLSKEKATALLEDLVNEVTVTDVDSAWMAVNRKVTLAYLAAPTLFPRIMRKFEMESDQDLQAGYRHLVQAMALLYHFHVTNMLTEKCVPIFLKFCIWLAPEGIFTDDSVFSTPVMPLQGSLRAYLAAGLLMWMSQSQPLEVDVQTTALEIVEKLKSDVFSVDSLKLFKVEFKLKVLQEMQMSFAVKKKQDDVPIEKEAEEKSEPIEELKSLSIYEGSSNNVQPATEDSEVSKEQELEQLNEWMQKFIEEKEKVPNPYLSYSNLIQFLNTNKSDEKCQNLLINFSKFWEDSNQSLNM